VIFYRRRLHWVTILSTMAWLEEQGMNPTMKFSICYDTPRVWHRFVLGSFSSPVESFPHYLASDLKSTRSLEAACDITESPSFTILSIPKKNGRVFLFLSLIYVYEPLCNFSPKTWCKTHLLRAVF
jgi:hypothetical protein